MKPPSFIKLARFTIIGLIVFAGVFSACGVKRYPDMYYRHPVQFDSDSPTPSPSPMDGTYYMDHSPVGPTASPTFIGPPVAPPIDPSTGKSQ